MQLIEFTHLDGHGVSRSISIAIGQIVSITAVTDDQCLLRLTNGQDVRVSESYDVVASLLMDSGATYVSDKITHRPPLDR